MLAAFYHEEQLTVGDETLRLVINFAALDAVESLTGRAFDRILADFTKKDAEPQLSLQGKVVWGLLRQHHPEITLDQVAALLFGPTGARIGAAIAKLMAAAFPAAEPADPKAKGANPRKPRGASNPS
ncbi:hypothetical protein ASE67_02645 [Sphingomonas sp. Leaf23]|uniref:hypothetical protein n=1 Tax=Sphingomonas sp. Leaf23 TaxID=1735689 RepID=UPI0006FD89CC|nr:hypothetical protein [Sphingomonas sp. Leaf23]KQM88658.1 hypothetical protein ASE67_02645 [Sphingomonas sp. Leaf23]